MPGRRRNGKFGKWLETRDLLRDIDAGWIDCLITEHEESFKDIIDQAVAEFKAIQLQKTEILGDFEKEHLRQRHAKATGILSCLDISTLIAEFIAGPIDGLGYDYSPRDNCDLYRFVIAIRADPTVWPYLSRHVARVLELVSFARTSLFMRMSRALLGEICRLRRSLVLRPESQRVARGDYLGDVCTAEHLLREGIYHLGSEWFFRYLKDPIRDSDMTAWWESQLIWGDRYMWREYVPPGWVPDRLQEYMRREFNDGEIPEVKPSPWPPRRVTIR